MAVSWQVEAAVFAAAACRNLSAKRLPLTLALSPQAGRGDVAYGSFVQAEGAAIVLLPAGGEKVPAGG